MVFTTLMEPHVRMAIWSRPSPSPDPMGVTPFEARCDGHWIAAPMDAPEWLLTDMEKLGEIFSAIFGEPGWRARCEQVVDRACPRFHQDAVSVRLITTYAGPGSEWAFERELENDLDAETSTVRNRIRTLAPGDVAILKGSAPGWEPWPDFPVVLHRSPPASRSSPRLVLTFDPFEPLIDPRAGSAPSITAF